MVKKKWAVICNSTNPDMCLYFDVKRQSFLGSCHFLAQYGLAKKLDCGVSAFSRSNHLSFWLLPDCIYSIFLAIFLRSRGVVNVLFDNAHISNIPLSLCLKILGVRQVFTIHDWDPHPGDNYTATRLYNYVVKSILADEFVVYSPVKSTKPLNCCRLGGYLANPVMEHDDYFLFYGRIEPYKGLNYLESIAEELDKRDPKINIVIAGRGEDPSLSNLSQMRNVKVINRFLESEELDRLIRGAVAVVLPYESASQSGVIVQAASYGKAVVAHDVGSLRYYVNDSLRFGILVEKGNTNDFVDAMLSILRNYESVSRQVAQCYQQLEPTEYADQFAPLFGK